MNTQRSRYQHIWQPIRIGNVEVKNRILMTAMTSDYSSWLSTSAVPKAAKLKIKDHTSRVDSPAARDAVFRLVR